MRAKSVKKAETKLKYATSVHFTLASTPVARYSNDVHKMRRVSMIKQGRTQVSVADKIQPPARDVTCSLHCDCCVIVAFIVTEPFCKSRGKMRFSVYKKMLNWFYFEMKTDEGENEALQVLNEIVEASKSFRIFR